MADERDPTSPLPPDPPDPLDPEPGDAPDPIEPPPPGPPASSAPAPVFAQLSDEAIAKMGNAVAQGIFGAAQALRPAPAIPTIEDVSDDEINSAVMRGENVAHLVRKMAHASTARERQALEARIADLEAQGSRAIGHLVRQSLQGREYYADYRTEIDGTLAQLPPAAQMNPETVDFIYTKVIGSHTPEIVAREREKALRQAREGAPDAGRGVAGRGTVEPSIRPEDVLGEEELAAARHMGGIEHVATKVLGYATLEDFLQSRKPEVQ